MSDPLQDYRERATQHRSRLHFIQAQLRRSEWLRIISFLSGAALGLLWFDLETMRAMVGAAALLCFAAFGFLVRRDRGLQRAADEAAGRVDLCEHGEARALRDWKRLESIATPDAPLDHPFAHDLGVVGHASIWKLVDVVSVAPGRARLRAWLLNESPPPDKELAQRQAAVRALAPMTEWREQLTLHARRLSARAPAALTRFIAWAAEPSWLLPRKSLVALSYVMPALTVLFFLALWLSVNAYAAAPVLLLINGVVTAFTLKRATITIESALVRQDDLAQYRALFAHAGTLQPATARLQQLHTQLQRPSALAALSSLERIGAASEARHNSIAYPILQFLFLWDLQLVRALERWRIKYGGHAVQWFTALGDLESLSALATLAHDNPDWVFPTVEARTDLSAQKLAHPLLPPARRVANDVSVGPPGSVLIVTGSNMSGKTTMLRAIGANVVLAYTGAPVCAASLSAPRLRIWTSIHVQDSLEEGRSLFAAELLRLRSIVDAARHTNAEPVLYLLDEVMRGTNAPERHVAVIAILEHLLETNAIGAITTHDLDLASAPELKARQRLAHFREYFEDSPEGTQMRFDYTLRPGPATTSNALALLRIMGLHHG